ncbi:adenylyltransferase/cytidyltransferase family protein [Haoranjiania flava]|uniref:Adenylyltransferase/cytidyltransferase family protein n=1 Tax=Haoranjiania flava TaxID=1856322 RepID=A0AAE3IMI1_9BACT|nr:adenylyltransferase/cytidyltransferase family protein [Haoranjiania flava]MCU7694629.1 adenylyltransferase/cytidyltransferase family protein [Haoranjiania flava]
MAKKVFVSGCYDMLHSGHVAFLEEAATYGDVYVGIGSDKTVYDLKLRNTINTQAERLYMIRSLKAVKEAWINSGSGVLDFVEEMKALQPDIFFVNNDGHSPEKEQLCKELGVEYVVSRRIPHGDLPARSTTALRKACRIPYRLDLAGGWLDQPYVNKLFPGPVITISIEPDYEFNHRSGMSTSSRNKAIELWETDIPEGNKEKLAKILFSFENPPGTRYISGSQDALGITLPGLNKLYYEKDSHWPADIISTEQEDILQWLESIIWMIPLSPRENNFDVLSDTAIQDEKVRQLSAAAEEAWNAILEKNMAAFGRAFVNSFDAQVAMFPNMITPEIAQQVNAYKDTVHGWKISGAGGGGYLILLSEKKIDKAIQIRIRRS